MRYQKFEIKNYKGISEVEIDFANNRILTLVGLNESGKTTVLESINLFYQLIKGSELSTPQLNEIRPKGIAFTGKIEICATLDIEPADKTQIQAFHRSLGKRSTLEIPDTFEYSFLFEFKTHTFQNKGTLVTFPIKAKGVTKYLAKSDKPHWQEIINFVKSTLVPEILYYEDFIFEIPEKIVFQKAPNPDQPVADVEDAKNRQWQKVLDDILKTINSEFTSFQEYVVAKWDSDNDTAMNRLSSMEGLLNDKITKGWKELFKDKNLPAGSAQSTRLNFKEIRLVATPSDDKVNFSFKVKNDSGREFQINERSKGFKWFFSFLIFTEFRKNRTGNILFLLDEPASNLHSSAQLKIVSAIGQLSNGSTVMYSTHSHHLINPVWLNGAYVVINDSISEEKLVGEFTEDSGAKITAQKYFDYVSKSGQSVKTVLFQPILDRLDYAPSAVEPIPNIVITEGKYDWYTFKYFFEIIFEETDELHLYPGAGCEQQWDILRLYLSWGKSFLLVLDGDSPGQAAQKQYVDEFDGFVSDRIFTLKDILSKEVATEALILDDDKKILCDAAFGEGSFESVKDDKSSLKSKLNFAINQLLIAKTKVTLSEETLANFRNLLTFIKSKKQS